ncbi:MAG TPA: hypothetical protein VLI69_07690 [Gammaproteobacteria bacterium]|nr:hypothetical protein [Gammaproteobacteria bacterium]
MLKKITSFFSTKSVQGKIANGALSETQLFIYFYLILMFDTISFVQQCVAIAGKQPTLLDWVNIWGLLVINAIGFIVLFLANGGSRGHDFLKKYFSLSFTVGYKYAILFFICTALLTSQAQGIAAVIILNTLMVTNIGFRIYQAR